MESKTTYTTDIEPGPPDLRTRLLRIATTLEAMQEQAADLQAAMQALKAQGLANAEIKFDDGPRKSGQPVMRLFHAPNSPTAPTTKRRREYIGTKPDRQREARDRISRWSEWSDYRRQLTALEQRISLVTSAISRAEAVAAEQSRLPGFD